MNFLAALWILVHALLAGAWPTPAPPVPAPAVGHQQPAQERRLVPRTVPLTGNDAERHTEGQSHAQVDDHAATVAPERPPGSQLPDEVIGRAVTCPDGQEGVVVDAQLDVSCPPPPPPAP